VVEERNRRKEEDIGNRSFETHGRHLDNEKKVHEEPHGERGGGLGERKRMKRGRAKGREYGCERSPFKPE